MLTFSFPYAHGMQSASFDEKNLAEVLEPNQVPLERRSVEQCIREALDTPIGSPGSMKSSVPAKRSALLFLM